MKKKPVILCILDGFGWADDGPKNACAQAKMPHWQALWQGSPHTLLQASDHFVGLPDGQMGNSEVGHMTLGAGRVILQDLPRVTHAFETGEIASHPGLASCMEDLKTSGKTVHLAGLLSPGGVHAHTQHIQELVRLFAAQGIRVAVHAFLDGRDTPPTSAFEYVDDFCAFLKTTPGAFLATLGGRYYGMDRDARWERVKRAYDVLVSAHVTTALSPQDYIKQSYAKNIGDEFVEPVAFEPYEGFMDGDAFVMANFRADRARQLMSALFFQDFSGFERGPRVPLKDRFGMCSYSKELDGVLQTLLPGENVNQSLGEVISKAGLTQLRLAETEKYAHVTFFFNGGREAPFEGEDRILVPSPKVATYDLQPEMSAAEVTDHLCQAIDKGTHDLIVVNYANTDMVGHTGIMAAAIKALETVDACLGRIVQAVEATGATLMITSDHGNIEDMGAHGHPHTAHTVNPVPFVVMGQGALDLEAGGLCDVAPTILSLMNLKAPSVMLGKSLIGKKAA